MKRVEEILERAAEERRRLIVPYVCAGDPDLVTTHAVVRGLGEAGAEILEIGMPFSDPVGDGPTVAAAASRALAAGATLTSTLALCAAIAPGPAIVLFGYLNPIVRYGIERFALDAGRAGVCGVIVADLPYEERALLASALRRNGVALVLLVAPSTPLERAIAIAEASDAFVYVVSRLGVTGSTQAPNLETVRLRLEALRTRTSRPIAVGFGIAHPEQVARIGDGAHAVVVGSALVEALRGRTGSNAALAAAAFLRPLVAAAALSRGAVRPSIQLR